MLESKYWSKVSFEIFSGKFLPATCEPPKPLSGNNISALMEIFFGRILVFLNCCSSFAFCPDHCTMLYFDMEGGISDGCCIGCYLRKSGHDFVVQGDFKRVPSEPWDLDHIVVHVAWWVIDAHNRLPFTFCSLTRPEAQILHRFLVGIPRGAWWVSQWDPL